MLEVCPYSPWLSLLLDELGHLDGPGQEVIVANPYKPRLTYENDSGNDVLTGIIYKTVD